MRLCALQLENFRNLDDQLFEAGARFNVLAGDNGQGKTNLLEAIYYTGTTRSFRTTHARELVRHGADSARVRARVERHGVERQYAIELGQGGRRVLLDGKEPRELAQYFGDFTTVLFAAEDLRVPRGTPSARRRFLDRAVFGREVGFLDHVQRYQRALKTRNRVLKESPRPALVEVYEEQLAEQGSRMVAARRRYLADLAAPLAEAYEAITRSGLMATATYDGDAVLEHPAAFLAALADARPRDLARRQTTVGPHLHDLAFGLAGRDAGRFGSQGQLRALVLAWKSAELRLLQQRADDSPILLLDDVGSELDPSRTAWLFEFLDRFEGQCFITTTQADFIPLLRNRLDFRVQGGRIVPQREAA